MMSGSQRLATRLHETRRRTFIGRNAELNLFRCTLSGEPGAAVFHVYGPAGTGKSSMLAEFARLAEEHGASPIMLDGREIEPTPNGLLTACASATGAAAGDCWTALSARPRAVILIDTYEDLAPLDSWLRDTFIPRLPDTAVLVLAGRHAPAPGWRSDPGLSALCRTIALRNLTPGDAREYLSRRNVDVTRHDTLVRMAHGHPLALALLADLAIQRASELPSALDHCPDIVQVLIERFIASVPSPQHRAALEVSALARITNEAVLADALDMQDTFALFDWLRSLSFMEQGTTGVFPHDLARDVIDADLHWRNPERYRELRRRIRVAMARRLSTTTGVQQQRVVYDKLFLHKRSAFMRPYFDFPVLDGTHIEPAKPADHGAVLDILRRHEGDESSAIAARWLEVQPDAFQVWRSTDGALQGFMAHLSLDALRNEHTAFDPALARISAHVQHSGGLRPGESVLIHRFWAGRDTYQDTASQTIVAAAASLRWMTTPHLAWSFPCTSDPERWLPMFTYCNFLREPSLDFCVGTRSYGVFAHDWRTEPATVWLDVLSARDDELSDGALPLSRPQPLLVLSRPDFDDAVRQALREYTRPTALAQNRLLQSRLVRVAGDPSKNVATLQQLLRASVEALKATPRDEKLHLAVWHTYFQPAESQELAAERLGLPFSTFRYRLKGGVDRICEFLWQQEIGGARWRPTT
jgi:hypothetical protein